MAEQRGVILKKSRAALVLSRNLTLSAFSAGFACVMFVSSAAADANRAKGSAAAVHRYAADFSQVSSVEISKEAPKYQ